MACCCHCVQVQRERVEGIVPSTGSAVDSDCVYSDREWSTSKLFCFKVSLAVDICCLLTVRLYLYDGRVGGRA